MSTGESKFACSQSMRSMSSRIDDDDGVELDPDRPILARRLDDDRELEVVREVEPAAKRAREDGRVQAVELENLLGDGLVLGVEEPMRSGAGDALVDELEVGGDGVVGGVVTGERFGEVENEIAFHARERMQRLGRAIEAMERGLVSQLAQRVGDFVLDFFLVERARQRRLVGGTGAGLLRLLPPIVEDDDIQCAHSVARL